jgi:hypothetical protein
MGLPDLYPAQVGSPYTTLAAPYTSGESTMTLADATKLPTAPNIVCLAGDVAGEFRYSEKDGNTLLGVVKLPGTPNATWPVGTYAFRGIAAYDLNAIHENMVRTATYVVAASDAPAHVKRQADYVCDGTDDAIVIQAAIDSMSSGTVHFSPGTYTISTQINLPEKISLYGSRGGTIFDCTSLSSGYAIAVAHNTPSWRGYATSAYPLLADASHDSTEIFIGAESISAGGFAAGDIVKIYDDESIAGGGNYKKGEIFTVKSVTETTIVPVGILDDSYTTSNNAHIRKLYPASNIAIVGIRFIGPGIETTPGAINLTVTTRAKIIDCIFEDFGAQAVHFTDSFDLDIDHNQFKNIFYTGLGYSVSIGNACRHIRITNNSFTIRGRHYIATGAGTGTYCSGGLPGYIYISGNYFESSTQEAINTHPPFSKYGPLIITENTFVDCGNAVETSNANLVFDSNATINCPYAVRYYTWGDVHRDCIISNNMFILTRTDLDSTKGGVYLKSKDSATVRISGNSFIGSGIYTLPGCENVTIDGNTFKKINASPSIYMYSSKNTRIANNIIDGTYLHFVVDSGDYLDFSENLEISNNIFKNPADADPIRIGASRKNVSVLNNVFQAVSGRCIRILTPEGVIIIRGNRFIDNTALRHAVTFETAATAPHMVYIEDNIFGSTIGSPIKFDTVSPPFNMNNFIITRNTGYVTESKGTATLLNTTTSIVVAHGCSATPTNITVTPSSIGNATKWWVDTIGDTTFTIHVDQDPGADITFYWKAEV